MSKQKQPKKSKQPKQLQYKDVDPKKFKTKTVMMKLRELLTSKFQPPIRIANAKKLAMQILEMGGVPGKIFIDVKNTIIDGHRRVAALLLLGIEEWPVEQFDVEDTDGTLFLVINTGDVITSAQYLSVYVRGGKVPDKISVAVKTIERRRGRKDKRYLNRIELFNLNPVTINKRFNDIRRLIGPNHFTDKEIYDWLLLEKQNCARAIRAIERYDIPAEYMIKFIEMSETIYFPEILDKSLTASKGPKDLKAEWDLVMLTIESAE